MSSNNTESPCPHICSHEKQKKKTTCISVHVKSNRENRGGLKKMKKKKQNIKTKRWHEKMKK
jgi:hypothetical protein